MLSGVGSSTRRQGGLDTAVAAALGTGPERLKRFEIAHPDVVLFRLPRPAVQGSPADPDMLGASLAQILCDPVIRACRSRAGLDQEIDEGP